MAITHARTNLETLDSLSISSSYMNSRRAKAQSPSCLGFKTKTRVFPLPLSDMYGAAARLPVSWGLRQKQLHHLYAKVVLLGKDKLAR